jgi:hypothetical protein
MRHAKVEEIVEKRAKNIGTPPLITRECNGDSMGWEKEGRSERKTSHAGIIRIGFEGISQPHVSRSTPVSINIIETRAAR